MVSTVQCPLCPGAAKEHNTLKCRYAKQIAAMKTIYQLIIASSASVSKRDKNSALSFPMNFRLYSDEIFDL